MKTFRDFADTSVGSWLIMGIAVMAFFIIAHTLAAALLPQSGPGGAIRAAVLSA